MPTSGGGSGERRAFNEDRRKVAELERRIDAIERTHRDYESNLRMARYGVITIRWLAVVGAAAVAIYAAFKGVVKP